MFWLLGGVALIVFSVAMLTNVRGAAEKFERVSFSWWLGLPPDHRWARRQVSHIRWSSAAGVLFGCLMVLAGLQK